MKTSGNDEMMRIEQKSSGFTHKILRIFTAIHSGETLTAFLLTLNFFLLLTAYYKTSKGCFDVGGV